MIRTFLLSLALMLSGCGFLGTAKPKRCEPVIIHDFKYRVPDIPASLTSPLVKPRRRDWSISTQKDVGNYILEMHETIDVGNTKLRAIKQYMNKLKAKTVNTARGTDGNN